MWQFGAQLAIHISAGHGGQQVHDEYCVPCSHQDEHGAGAGACQSPTHAKNDAAVQVAGNALVFVLDQDLLAGCILQVLSFDELHNDDSSYHRRAYDAIHVKALETEHFINAEVGYRFAFVQCKAEQHAHQYISRHSHG